MYTVQPKWDACEMFAESYIVLVVILLYAESYIVSGVLILYADLYIVSVVLQ